MDNRPIGVFDSGLGGLTVMKELIAALPGESIIYFGDTGRVPYGTRSRETILKYSAQDMNFLMKHDVKMIVIACGTASSVALDYAAVTYDVPVIGVVEATARAAAAATRNGRIGIIGTRGTVTSGSYQRILTASNFDRELTVIPRACPLFVPLVENGYADGEVARLVARDYLAPLAEAGVDTIILGCTHYPLLKGVISDIMGSETVLIDGGAPVAAAVARLLDERGLRGAGGADYRYFVSDHTGDFAKLGGMFMEREISDSVMCIDIEAY
ncbi:glutamate racemase [Clostridia bacterium]|nr:glutamate racemase [Clostridia bacterium]